MNNLSEMQNFDVTRYLLSLWPTGTSFITKTIIVPEKSIPIPVATDPSIPGDEKKKKKKYIK